MTTIHETLSSTPLFFRFAEHSEGSEPSRDDVIHHAGAWLGWLGDDIREGNPALQVCGERIPTRCMHHCSPAPFAEGARPYVDTKAHVFSLTGVSEIFKFLCAAKSCTI